MASAFNDNDNVVPVKLEIKEFYDKPNTLYVAIALNKIKMTEFYQRITQQTTQEINNKINTIQNDIKTIQNEMNQYVNYIQEENLNIPTTGTHEEQVKSCETLLDRMKEIVQQKEWKPMED